MDERFETAYSISVVMPAYNAEKFIASSIESVLNQTYQNWELIIIDDASTDKTSDIISEYASSDKRIVIERNDQNHGVTYTRKRAIERASASWVAMLDSDDAWTPDKLERQALLAKELGRPALIYTGTAYVNEEGKRSSYQLVPPREIDFGALLEQNFIMNSSVLVHRSLLKPDETIHDGMHEDYAMWLSILKEEPLAFAIPEPLNIYRISSGSKSSNKVKAALMNYRTLRHVGVQPIKAISSMAKYARNNIKKYAEIYKGFE